MRRDTYIRKTLGMKAHWVTEMVETDEGWMARIDRLGNLHLICSRCGGEVSGTRGRRSERSWQDPSLRDKPFWIVYGPFRVFCPWCGLRGSECLGPRSGNELPWPWFKMCACWLKKFPLKKWRNTLDWKVLATLVFGRFNVAQHLNRTIDEVRRAEVRRLAKTDVIDPNKTRFILLKTSWNLVPK